LCCVRKDTGKWSAVRTEVIIRQDNAWKIGTRWQDKSVYQIQFKGGQEIAEHIKLMNCLLRAPLKTEVFRGALNKNIR
jgi:hypothetical protein